MMKLQIKWPHDTGWRDVPGYVTPGISGETVVEAANKEVDDICKRRGVVERPEFRVKVLDV